MMTTTSTRPTAAPVSNEELIFSIFISDSHLHWATHLGKDQGYTPKMFWRTPFLTTEILESKSEAVILSQYLTDDPHVHDYIYGKTVDVTTASDDEQSNKRSAALISVYVVSVPTLDQNVQEDLLARMWKALPCRFVVIGKDAFFPNEEGTPRGTADQLAILAGAIHLHGNPALVFDARRGMAVTYSSTDSNGKILHVADYTGLALRGRNVIQNWLSSTEVNAPIETRFNSGRRVVCTGGNEDILIPFLQTMPSMSHDGLLNARQYSVESSKNIIHYGIACVLSKHDSLRNSGGDASIRDTTQPFVSDVNLSEESWAASEGKRTSFSGNHSFNSHVGERVAKFFEGHYLSRGTVVQLEQILGKSYCLILYDDLETERVAPNELPGMLRLFEKVGEEEEEKIPETRKSMRLSKKKSKTTTKKATGKENSKRKSNATNKMSGWFAPVKWMT